jgi:hypothetical protein
VQLFPGPAGSILRAGVLLCDSRFLQEKNRGPQKRGSALPSLERDGFDPLTRLRAEAEFADILQVSLRRAQARPAPETDPFRGSWKRPALKTRLDLEFTCARVYITGKAKTDNGNSG